MTTVCWPPEKSLAVKKWPVARPCATPTIALESYCRPVLGDAVQPCGCEPVARQERVCS